MPRTMSFGVADLRNIFFPVFDRYTDETNLYVNLGGGLAALARKLDRITANLDVSDNQGAMAEIMVMITQLVYNEAQIIYPPDEEDLCILRWRLLTEFSVECAIFFAQEQGYSIDLPDIPLDQVGRLLLVGDNWKQLTQLFDESLRAAGVIPELEVTENSPDDCQPGSLESSLNVELPLGRLLSAESYSNLRSQAYQQRWTEAEILMLIEEHLRPHLDPFALHYSETVSGEQWLALYRWLHN
jgi:hypothetical protein